MLTKQGEMLLGMEKEGSILAAVGHAAGAHVLQNYITKKTLGNSHLTDQLGRRFMNALKGVKMGNFGGEVPIALGRSVIPEAGILNSELAHLGKDLKGTLERMGITPKDMTPKHWESISDALEGNFSKMIEEGGDSGSLAITAMGRPLKRLGIPDEMISTILKDAIAEGNGELVKDLEQVYKGIDFTGKTLSGAGKFIRSNIGKPSGNNVPTRVLDRMHLTADVVGSGALSLVDPLTGIVNVGKKVMASKRHNTGVLKKFRDWADHKFVTKPLEAKFRKGLEGNDLRFPKTRKFIGDYVVNPLVSDMEQFGYDTGRVLHKHRLVEKILKSGALPEATAIKNAKKEADLISAKTKFAKMNLEDGLSAVRNAPHSQALEYAAKDFGATVNHELPGLAKDFKRGISIANSRAAGMNRVYSNVQKMRVPTGLK